MFVVDQQFYLNTHKNHTEKNRVIMMPLIIIAFPTFTRIRSHIEMPKHSTTKSKLIIFLDEAYAHI